MKVGDYVRTDKGEIAKVISIANDNDFGLGEEYRGFVAFNTEPYVYGDVIKSSPNIIDLIEVGDYVNGYLITSVYDDDSIANEYNLKHKKCLGKNIYDEDYQEYLIYEEDIKSIVTHEQFSQMEYRIGE